MQLKGLTWAHTRGFAPLSVLGRVWEDTHPDQEVVWQARSLRSFGEEPLAPYLDDFDLFVFDYPFAGEALAQGWVLPLDDLLLAELIATRRQGTVGPLHDAFLCAGRLAALAIDVATHVAASRPDLLATLGVKLPSSWEETVTLARETGRVAMPARPTGIWGAFLTLCANAGDQPFHRDDGAAFALDHAASALGKLQDLARHLEPWCLETYPVALLNRMAATDTIAYVPLTYGYCTYGLAGYAPHRLAFHDPRLGSSGPRGAILGGAGIGVSSRSRHPREAALHAAWLTSPDIQRTLYVQAGGQPAQRAAWQDAAADRLTNGFFSGTIGSAETAYVRPNKVGFHDFQNFAAGRLHAAVVHQEPVLPALHEIAAAWRAVGQGHPHPAAG